MVMLTILTIFLGALVLVYWLIHRKFQYWKNKNVPHIEPEFFYGNSRGLGKDFAGSEFVRRMYFKLKSSGPISGIYVYIQPQAFATNLDLIKNIFVKDFHIFTNRGLYFNEKDDPLSANLGSLEDDEWRSVRQKISPIFTSGKIKMMFETVTDISDKLIKTIQKETAVTGQLEVKEVLSRFTIDVIGNVAFGIECNSLENPNNKFYEMGLKHFGAFTFMKRILLGINKSLAKFFHISLSDKEANAFYMDVIRSTVNYRKQNPHLQRNDFLNLLLKLKGPDALTFNQIAAQSSVFLTAGFETTATTMTYCMFELSINEDIQKKLRESVKDVLKRHGDNFTYESVNEMDYLEQCINESLRKYPPAQAATRIVKENYPVPNTNIVIDKGTLVMIPISGIHWDPDIYPNPSKYDPDRFLPHEVEKRHQYAFLPFGEGPRMCVGMRFAIVEMKITLAKILTNFEFSLDRTKTSVPLVFEPKQLILTPKQGIVINFKKI